MSQPKQSPPVVGGVDTQKDLHVAAVVDHQGQVLGTQSFPTTRQAYRLMLVWMQSIGDLLLGPFAPQPARQRRKDACSPDYEYSFMQPLGYLFLTAWSHAGPSELRIDSTAEGRRRPGHAARGWPAPTAVRVWPPMRSIKTETRRSGAIFSTSATKLEKGPLAKVT